MYRSFKYSERQVIDTLHSVNPPGPAFKARYCAIYYANGRGILFNRVYWSTVHNSVFHRYQLVKLQGYSFFNRSINGCYIAVMWCYLKEVINSPNVSCRILNLFAILQFCTFSVTHVSCFKIPGIILVWDF